MKKSVVYLVVVLTAIIAFGGIYYLNRGSLGKKLSTININNSGTSKQIEKPTVETLKKSSDYFFPLPDYFSRIKIKKFGQIVKSTDKFNVPCGADFSGFHDGDDLEVSPSEIDTEVPVHAVAAGKVLQVGHVSGYGGLLVQSASLNGQDITVYYGHINYLTVKVKSGEEVTPDETIAFLGKGCSSETDGERKHLHFAVHNGNGVDVRGYVPSDQILQSWINPGEILKSLNASEPKP